VPTGLPLLEACSARDLVIRDGVVESVSLSGRAFLSHGDRLFREMPIRGVRLVAIQPFVRELASCPHLAHVHALDLTGNQLSAAGLRELLESPHARFDSIDLAQNGLGDEGLRALASWPGFASLRSLGLSGNGLTEATLGLLADAANLDSLTLSRNPLPRSSLDGLPGSLRSLALSGCEVASLDLRRLTLLEHLNLSHNVGAAREGTRFPDSLLHLDLSFCEIDSCREEWPRLRSLKLRGNRLQYLESRLPPSLEAIDLALNPLGDVGVRCLAERARPANLKSLDLTNVGLTRAGLEFLDTSGWLAGLEHLSLDWNPCVARVGS